MSANGETPAIKIILAILGTVGIIGGGIFTFLSSKYSIDRPILATQTAEALRVTQTVAALLIEQTAVAVGAQQTGEAWRAAQTVEARGASQTAVARRVALTEDAAQAVRLPPTVPLDAATPTPPPVVQPYFTIENRLTRGVTILVDNRRLGEAPANGERAFLLQSWPVTVEFRVPRPANADGDPLGEELSGHWTDPAEPGSRYIMDNTVGDTRYFYLVLTNETATACGITVNKGLEDEQVLPASLPADSNYAYGYYTLHDDSTVWLTCGDQSWYWGQKDATDDAKPLADQLETGSGALYLTLEK